MGPLKNKFFLYQNFEINLLKLWLFFQSWNFYLCFLILKNYSYFNDFTGSNFAALNAGKIETIIVIIIEEIDIIKIEVRFISDGILLKKYISSGNKVMLNVELRNCLKFSI